MVRRSRFERSHNALTTSCVTSPFISHHLPFFDPLDEEQIIKLKVQLNWIREHVGVAFRDDPKAIDLWTSAGAKVDGDIVSAGADWIRALCAKAPSEFTQIARNPERSVKIGGSNQVFAPIYGATFVRDLKEEQRYGDMESFTKLLMLTQMLPSLHHSGLVIVEPCDVPVSKRHLEMF